LYSITTVEVKSIFGRPVETLERGLLEKRSG